VVLSSKCKKKCASPWRKAVLAKCGKIMDMRASASINKNF